MLDRQWDRNQTKTSEQLAPIMPRQDPAKKWIKERKPRIKKT
jgi:hypothetical protein